MPINLQGALAKSSQGEYMLAIAALIMFPELTLEKQKEWLLTKKFDDKSILSFLASYDEYSARNNIPKYLTVCFEILKDFHSKTVLTSEEIFSLLEDESLQTICFFKTPELTPHYVALCNALCESALDVDRVRVMNRCLDIWRKAYPIDAVSLSVSVEHSAEVCYEFLEKCLAQRASAITIIEIVRRRGWYARWVTEQEIGAIFRILGQLFASNAYLEDENKTIITEIAKFLFSYSWSFNRSETEFSKLIEFFDEIAKTKDFKIGDKEILELFVVNPEKFTFRCHVQAHFSFLWKYLFKLVKSVDNKKIIQAFFIATRNGSFNSIDVPWNHSIIQILENIEKIPDYLRPNPQEFFLALAAFIEQDCFDDEVLKRLFRFKKQIVAATLQRIGEAKATGIDVLSPELNDTEYRLALASQDPTRGLGRFLNGCNEPAASTEALSELGKLLFKKEYLQKILEAIRAGHFNSDQLKGLAFLKDELLAQIEQEPQKVELYMEILNKKTLLGEYFHLKRRPVPNPLGPKNVQKARARLVERHMAEIIDKLKAYSLSSSFLEGLGNVRKEIIAHIASTSTDFWSDYLAAIKPNGYLNTYFLANNEFNFVTPDSSLMEEMNTALCAKPELLLTKLRKAQVSETASAEKAPVEAVVAPETAAVGAQAWKELQATVTAELPEECYPALKSGSAALITYFKSLTHIAQRNALLSEALEEGTPLNKFFACHSASYLAELETLQATASAPVRLGNSLNEGGPTMFTPRSAAGTFSDSGWPLFRFGK